MAQSKPANQRNLLQYPEHTGRALRALNHKLYFCKILIKLVFL
ncbi:hypothetical protein PTUN_b0408 [Pseudoalteromonas tunicata]|uniref:Uncharacterized protein n=1 Tax=Pseudoalteromonas tunicata D2 TaxID=87626 RepID=A4C596_9GAMM|nr:hypothetical protein PTUN_b0408 [Pseudoalteromonas tunicata]EAR30728.1 hypothetical protein PTD2_04126 [Pseudoalteromonas tunicata D2]